MSRTRSLLPMLLLALTLCCGLLPGCARSRQTRACLKLGDLCGAKVSLSECQDGLAELRRAVGDAAQDRALECIDGADSCLGAGGCLTGAGVAGAGQFFKGVFQGLGGSVPSGHDLLDGIKKTVHEATE